jgi:CHASE2 domain
MGGRSLGWLQLWEWQAYDVLMRMRPAEAMDERLLVVAVTEEDIGKYGFAALETDQPRTIGLDIYRDRAVGAGGDRLRRLFQSNRRLVAVCSDKIDQNPNKPGIAPPSGVSESRLGFSDVVPDADGEIRRHLMFMQPHHTSPCVTNYALSTRLALNYLAADGIVPQTLPPKQVLIGNVLFNPLKTHSGAYQNLDDRGFQVMLNYRLNDRASPHAIRQVGLSQLLSGKINADWVRNRNQAYFRRQILHPLQCRPMALPNDVGGFVTSTNDQSNCECGQRWAITNLVVAILGRFPLGLGLGSLWWMDGAEKAIFAINCVTGWGDCLVWWIVLGHTSHRWLDAPCSFNVRLLWHSCMVKN